MLVVMWFGHTGHSLSLSPISISCEAYQFHAKEGVHPRAPTKAAGGRQAGGEVCRVWDRRKG